MVESNKTFNMNKSLEIEKQWNDFHYKNIEEVIESRDYKIKKHVDISDKHIASCDYLLELQVGGFKKPIIIECKTDTYYNTGYLVIELVSTIPYVNIQEFDKDYFGSRIFPSDFKYSIISSMVTSCLDLQNDKKCTLGLGLNNVGDNQYLSYMYVNKKENKPVSYYFIPVSQLNAKFTSCFRNSSFFKPSFPFVITQSHRGNLEKSWITINYLIPISEIMSSEWEDSQIFFHKDF